jgi:signal peptidase II
LIISGGIGNLLDRVFNQGKVIDFIILSIGNIHTGIFNIADFYITSGVLLLIIFELFTKIPSSKKTV